MLTSKEIGKLTKFIENRRDYPFVLETNKLTTIVDKDKTAYLLMVTDEFDRVLFLAEDKFDNDSILEVREYYTSQAECDLVENMLRGIL